MSEPAGQTNRPRQGTRPRGFRLRLAGQILLAALVSLLVVEIAWLSVYHVQETARIPTRAESQTRMLLAAAVDTRIFPTLSNEKAVIERIATLADIVGARLEDTAGEPLAVVGEEPDVTALEAQRHGIGARLSADRRHLDVYVPAEELGFLHPMIVRVDLSSYHAGVRRALIDTAVTVANIAVLTATGLFFALYPILFRPIARIRDAIMRGVSDLDIADSFRIRWNRNDEFDDLARAVNELLFSASKNYSDTLHTAHEALSRSPVATFVCRPGGELAYANPAALELFGADSVEHLAAEQTDFVILGKDADAPPVGIEAMLADGPVADEGFVVTPAGKRSMICMGDVVRRLDGSVRRSVAQFLDMDRVLTRMARLAAMSERATRRRIVADQRSLKLRIMLESCLSILDDESVQAEAETGADIIEIESIIKTWARVHATVGKARRVLYNRLPQLVGKTGILAPLFRQALSYADFRAVFRDSELRVIASTRGDGVRFEISERETDNCTRKDTTDLNRTGEITLSLNALARLVERCGGTLDLDEAQSGPVRFSFTLPQTMTAAGGEAETRDAA